MDTDHIAALVRTLRTTPSRRAISTAVVALAASTALAPLFDHAGAGGKGGGGKGGGKDKKKGKDKDKKKKRNIDPLPPLPPAPQCALGESFCTVSGTCCATGLCKDCGCCPGTQPSCCGDVTTTNRLCYSTAEESCCPATGAGVVGACPKLTFCATERGGIPICCPSGSEKCEFGCCEQGTFCCSALDLCCDNSACDQSTGSCFAIGLGTSPRFK